MSDTPFLSVIIPAYNEAKRIIPTLERYAQYLDQQSFNYDIWVVDDGSNDQSVSVVKTFQESQPHVHILLLEHNQGKGAAVRAGMLASKGAYACFTDADGATPPEAIGPILKAFEHGADVVIGSRQLPASRILKTQPLLRRIVGRVFNMLTRAFLIPGIADTQCGFKGFTREAAQRLFDIQVIDGFSFDVEILAWARHLGYRIERIPVDWTNDSQSRVATLKHSFSMFVDLIRIWWHTHTR